MMPWVKRGLVALCAWAGTFGFAVLTDRHPHPVALAAATTAVLTVGWLCADAYQHAENADWSLYRAPAPERTFDPRFSRLSQELDEDTDREAASIALHADLTAVADRILLDKYDVDRQSQPAVARDILGDRVWAYVDVPPSNDRVVFTPLLFDVLDRLESL